MVVGLIGTVVAGFLFLDFFFIFVGLLLTNVIFGILVMLFASKTNAWAELRSSMRGTPILHMYRRDKVIQKVTCKYNGDNAETAKYGTFIITPESVYRDKKTGIATLAAISTTGATIDPKYFSMANQMKAGGMNDIYEAEAAEKKEKFGVKIPFMETIRFEDFKNFLKENLSPHYIQALIERKTALGLRGVRQIPMAWIGTISIFLVMAAIAYVIINSVNACQYIGLPPLPPIAAPPPPLIG